MAKPYDAASKHLIESRPSDWLRLTGFPVPILESDVSIVDADLSNVVTTAADKLIKVENVPDGLGPYLAHIEFQSSADPGLDARVLLAMQILMGLKYQEQLTERLMQSISEMEDSVEWQKIFRRGRAEGEARGKTEGERLAILRLGSKRFGPPNEAIAARLNSLSRDADLEQLMSRFHDVSSWEQLLSD